MPSAIPPRQGLYDPAFEHDACGVAFVVDLHGRRTHRLVEQGITALCNLEHRGASGCEVNTGDGAGLLIQVPDAFYRAVVGFDLPEAGAYATAAGSSLIDAKTLKEVWRFEVGSPVNAPPVTYSIGGKQYIAVSTGIGGGTIRNCVESSQVVGVATGSCPVSGRRAKDTPAIGPTIASASATSSFSSSAHRPTC